MKTLLTSVAVLAMATSAYAGSTKWKGNTGSLSDMCSFIVNQNGDMSYSEANQKWTVDDPAVVRIKTRNANNLNIAAGELVSEAETHNVTVNYSGSTIKKGNTRLNANVNTDGIQSQLSNGVVTVTLDGSATMDDNSVVLDSNTDYYIEHTITCIQ